MWAGFALTVFISAFSAFLIQPVVGKIVTPQFGGVASVWCLCLLFFQTTLLGGYTMAFLLSRFSFKTQAIGAMLLFLISAMIAWVPLPGAAWIPENPETPIHDLLKVLIANLLFPSVLLSMVSVLLQNWYRLYCAPSEATQKTVSLVGSPYPLYSISNTGSLLALFVYPVVIEPLSTISGTVAVWNWLYRFLVGLVFLISLKVMRTDETYGNVDVTRQDNQPAPSWHDYVWWLALSTGGTSLLISLTNSLTSDIAPIPLLWILPLAVYLVTFIVAFSGRKLYRQNIVIFVSQLLLIVHLGTSLAFMQSVPLVSVFQYLVLLFALCMMCHGELASRKPSAQYLAHFYLSIAAGGVVGGVLVNLGAPLVFDAFTERIVILVAFACLTVFLTYQARQYKLQIFYRPVANGMYLIGFICLFLWESYQVAHPSEQALHRERNFYGAVRVIVNDTKDAVALYDGAIVHGFQVLNPQQHLVPTAYYSIDSAVGIADSFIRRRHAGQPVEYGVIGLGAGTIAAYGQNGDSIVFYELDPKIKRIAEQYFSFLGESKAHVDVALGDARQTLKKQPARHFDMLVVDAFNGDSVPYHLLTREAMGIFLKHVKPEGIILFHVSSRNMNLAPVINNLAISMGLTSLWVGTAPTERDLALHSDYVAVSREQVFSEAVRLPEFKQVYPNVMWLQLASNHRIGVWTDDYVNLLSVLKIF